MLKCNLGGKKTWNCYRWKRHHYLLSIMSFCNSVNHVENKAFIDLHSLLLWNLFSYMRVERGFFSLSAPTAAFIQVIKCFHFLPMRSLRHRREAIVWRKFSVSVTFVFSPLSNPLFPCHAESVFYKLFWMITCTLLKRLLDQVGRSVWQFGASSSSNHREAHHQWTWDDFEGANTLKDNCSIFKPGPSFPHLLSSKWLNNETIIASVQCWERTL